MWDDLVAWLQSPGGARVLQTAIIPAISILVAGVLAALIARSAVRATIRRAERVEAASAVAGLVAAARAAADREADGGSRRRAVRLRTEADVRTRLLPLHGADLAADWAATRTDALQALPDDAAVALALGDLRDRLVDWVGKPARARRIFTAAAPATPAAPVAATAPEAPEPQTVVAAAPAPAVAPVEEDTSDQDRFARPGPRRTPPEPAPEPEPELVAAAAAVTPAAVTAPPAPPVPDAVPAWQRTRAVERLQQERGRSRGVEAPTAETVDDEGALSTAPVALARAHRAETAQPPAPPAPPAPQPEADADEAVRLEAHQQARHARPTDQANPATGAAPTPTPAPAWLDQYDDEAQVTQNLDLKTPPPVAATAVRDRGTPGEDLVPRS